MKQQTKEELAVIAKLAAEWDEYRLRGSWAVNRFGATKQMYEGGSGVTLGQAVAYKSAMRRRQNE